METAEITGQGGPGRGQGRKPIAPDARPYKLLLPGALRRKLDELGGAQWLREQIDFAVRTDATLPENAMNMSARYINALRQLPQYHCNIETRSAALTHVMTGVRVLPTGDLQDPDDVSGILEIVYPGGHSIQVPGGMFLDLAVAEGARLEVETTPEEFELHKRKWSLAQLRAADLKEHLVRKHGLE